MQCAANKSQVCVIRLVVVSPSAEHEKFQTGSKYYMKIYAKRKKGKFLG
jgi:hypothetical protein